MAVRSFREPTQVYAANGTFLETVPPGQLVPQYNIFEQVEEGLLDAFIVLGHGGSKAMSGTCKV